MFQTAIFQSARILVSLADQYDSDLHGIVSYFDKYNFC